MSRAGALGFGMSREGLARIHVIGAGGSGKTTLARRLGALLGLPVYELDRGGRGPEDVARDAAWVTEGIFLFGMGPLFEAAEEIIWLDLPFRVCARRILFRHLRLSLARRNPHKGLRRLVRFLRGMRRYHSTTAARVPARPDDWDALSRAATAEALRPFASKTVVLSSARAVGAWILQLARA